MIVAVVDTNVLVRGVLSSHPSSASRGVVDALFADRFQLLLSPATLEEIQRVLSEDDMRSRHGQTDRQVNELCRSLELKSRMIEPTTKIAPSLTRDLTDTKWLALALDGNADFLVTLDRRR